jgi:hypothetical protein
VIASAATTRLFAQGVQVEVPAARSGAPIEPTSANFVGDITTRSMALYVERNLTEARTAPEALTRAEGTIGEPTNLYVPRPWPIPLLRRASRSAAARRMAPIALSSLATLTVCWLLWGRAPRTASPRGLAVAVAPLRTPVVPGRPLRSSAPSHPRPPSPIPAASAVVAAVLPATTNAAAAPARCSARIASRPAGAIVMMGERRLGLTPVEVRDLPCGPTSVTLSHARYRPASAVLDAQGAVDRELFVRMVRPDGRLVLRSTPSHATFVINHSVVGTAPREVTVMRFETIHIEATLPGHRPWRQVLYLTAPRLDIDAHFTSLRSKAVGGRATR